MSLAFRIGKVAVFFALLLAIIAGAAAPSAAGHIIVPKSVFLDPGLRDAGSDLTGPNVRPPAGARFFTISAVLSSRNAETLVHPVNYMQPSAAERPAQLGYSELDSRHEPFGLFLFPAPEGELWVKWRKMERAISEEMQAIERCRADIESCSREAAAIVDLSDQARLLRGFKLVQTVNVGINDAIKYRSDMDQFGEADHWSTPLETARVGVGDCEDYAITKYMVLLQAGVSANDIKILLARDMISRQDHAVVAVQHEGNWLILDNRWLAIASDRETKNLSVLFALSMKGVELFAAPYASRMEK